MSGKEEAWSVNDEDFRYDSLRELIDNNRDELNLGVTVYVGEATRPTMYQLCDADDVIETMADRAYDIGGEYAEGFPCVSQAARDELNDLLSGWLEKHCIVDFYSVSNVKPYVLTDADFGTADPQPESSTPEKPSVAQ
jgi:hypothetical protein